MPTVKTGRWDDMTVGAGMVSGLPNANPMVDPVPQFGKMQNQDLTLFQQDHQQEPAQGDGSNENRPPPVSHRLLDRPGSPPMSLELNRRLTPTFLFLVRLPPRDNLG